MLRSTVRTVSFPDAVSDAARMKRFCSIAGGRRSGSARTSLQKKGEEGNRASARLTGTGGEKALVKKRDHVKRLVERNPQKY